MVGPLRRLWGLRAAAVIASALLFGCAEDEPPRAPGVPYGTAVSLEEGRTIEVTVEDLRGGSQVDEILLTAADGTPLARAPELLRKRRQVTEAPRPSVGVYGGSRGGYGVSLGIGSFSWGGAEEHSSSETVVGRLQVPDPEAYAEKPQDFAIEVRWRDAGDNALVLRIPAPQS